MKNLHRKETHTQKVTASLRNFKSESNNCCKTYSITNNCWNTAWNGIQEEL